MDINTLLQGVHCECGKHHTCPIQWVYIEQGAAKRLTAICENYRHILLVADENTFAAAGKQVEQALSGKQIEKVIFSGKEILVPNEDAIHAVQQQLQDVDMIIGIGSGVIQDLCKYVSFHANIPYIIVATAPSMDGYASDGAAMITSGMKVTYAAGLPLAILADVDVLKEAPLPMLQSGFGDVIGKFSALNDWKLSQAVNGEYLCPYIYHLTYEQVQTTLQLADGILKRDADSIKALMEALIVIGIMMSFAGSSRPASGSEHHLSHFFEITGILKDEPYFSHGVDVAFSTVITAQLRENILSRPFPTALYRHDQKTYTQKMKEIYLSSADGCMALQEKVGHYKKDRAPIYQEKEKEKEIRHILAEMPTAKEIADTLALVNLDMAEFYGLYSQEKINNAVLFAKELKDRYTVLWMHYDFFGGQENV